MANRVEVEDWERRGKKKAQPWEDDDPLPKQFRN
jgi:hypothetical protein